ncbi:MAG: dTDP-4-dehydrorhamnose 3,5-epimerase family protein [Vicinamibacteria bacterium]|jgi:dTDP-4-dehydrorhamnose 3,5-epimerase|nr:dTDP-4-dehydrorhamnose 3,5-epimerase family protein [Vicinamibacteria bacterium]
MRAPKPRPATRRAAGLLSPREGFLRGAAPDAQQVRSDWLPHQAAIEGVSVRETRNVSKGRGYLTEMWRSEWQLGGSVEQVFQALLGPHEISAWHVHQTTCDRLFVNHGSVRVVLYDARRGGSSFGVVNTFRFGAHRPALLIVPAGVWHGLQNLLDTPSSVINIVDHAYSYEAPDHWRLPADSRRIPYRFPAP